MMSKQKKLNNNLQIKMNHIFFLVQFYMQSIFCILLNNLYLFCVMIEHRKFKIHIKDNNFQNIIFIFNPFKDTSFLSYDTVQS